MTEASLLDAAVTVGGKASITLLQALACALVVERIVANLRNVLTPKNGPWPETAAALSIFIALVFDLRIVEGMLGPIGRPLWGAKVIIDNFLAGLFISGGASGIVETYRRWNERRDKLVNARAQIKQAA